MTYDNKINDVVYVYKHNKYKDMWHDRRRSVDDARKHTSYKRDYIISYWVTDLIQYCCSEREPVHYIPKRNQIGT